MKELDKQIETMMSQGENTIGIGSSDIRKAHVCHVCGKEGKSSHIKDHIEANHLKGISIPCSHCDKYFSTRHALRCHTGKIKQK